MANMNSEFSRSKFMNAINANNIGVVEGYLQRGLNPNFERQAIYNVVSHTPLMMTAHLEPAEQYVMIQLLIKYGADPNYTNDTGSALHWTIYQGPLDPQTDYPYMGIPHLSSSLIYLLENGANPFICDELYETPYDICMTNPNIHDSNALILKEFMDIIRIQRCYRRKMTRNRVKTIKNKRKLALMKCMEFREGPLSTIRYDPSLLERISKFI